MSTLAISACQNSPRPSLEFTTFISDSGHKLFELTLPAVATEIRLPGERRRDSLNEPQFSERQATAELELHLQQSGYCRQGYVLLGRYAGQTSRRMRGECVEKASAEDKREFANTIKQW